MVEKYACLLPVTVTLLALLHLANGNHWSTWTRWSACSRTCDGGATYQIRRCVRSRTHTHGCKSQAIRYNTCNNEPCPPGTPDFRSEQCSAYNDPGDAVQWTPHRDVKNPCALSCKVKGREKVVILAPKVLDGTRCNSRSLNMCINGECWNVGCDHLLNSNKKLDQCGVCGGTNNCDSSDTSSHRSHGNRFMWTRAGVGPCSVTCGVGGREERHVCIHRVDRTVHHNRACRDLPGPTRKREICQMGSCPSEWKVGPWQNCTRDCGVGVAWRIVTCVRTLDDGKQQWVRDSFCSNIRPSSRKSCNTHICPTWYAGQWSICSVSCGTGYQHREVFCRHVGDRYCRDVDRPRIVKNCTTGIPCFSLNDIRYTKTRRIGQTQERSVGEFTAGQSPLGDEGLRKEDLSTPRFVVSEWGGCSTTCGEGLRFRFVRCQVYLRYLDDFADLPDTDCEEEKPTNSESCFVEPCYDEYEFKAVGMTACSQSCLGGIQETIVKCVSKVNGSLVPDDYCIEAPQIQIDRSICNDKPCPQRWNTSSFGECSATCGGGEMSRSVDCIQEFAQGPDNVLQLPLFMCPQPSPARVERCNTQDCPAEWQTGDWSSCSVTCGTGIYTRTPLCQRLRNNGVLVTVAPGECHIELKPTSDKLCVLEPCPEPMIKTKQVTFFQLKKLPKVRLHVGMSAHILPGTTVIAKCNHVGLDRQKVVWFQNGRRIKKFKRLKVSKSGTLRIRHSRPDKDNGTYICRIGGLEANLMLDFIFSFDVLQATITREKYVQGRVGVEENVMNGSYVHTDPFDRRKKVLYTVSSDWTLCSVSCGGGLQSRNMSCEIITDSYYQVFPMEVCIRYLPEKPLKIRSCNTNPCVTWNTGDWSECLDNECVRDGFSIQRRPVFCALEVNRTAIEDDLCTGQGFPPDNLRDCLNPNCTAVWNVSKWSECTAECDEKGYKTRILTCLWNSTGLIAQQGSCDHLEIPRTVRKCKGEPCSSFVCEDDSDNCSIVRLMNMCSFSNFEQRCCATCSPYYYYDYEDTGDTTTNEVATTENTTDTLI